MPIEIVNGPMFQPGESLSDAIDISHGNIVRITCPGQWSPANLTFQISTDGASGFNDLYTAAGEEVTIIVRGDNSAIIVRDPWSRCINFIKFRSGTSKHPVVQENGALFAVAIETEAPAGDAEPARMVDDNGKPLADI